MNASDGANPEAGAERRIRRTATAAMRMPTITTRTIKIFPISLQTESSDYGMFV